MQLFGFTDDIFEQQDCLCYSKFKELGLSVIERFDEHKENINSHYSTLKELANNRMAVLKKNIDKITDGDTAHYSK